MAINHPNSPAYKRQQGRTSNSNSYSSGSQDQGYSGNSSNSGSFGGQGNSNSHSPRSSTGYAPRSAGPSRTPVLQNRTSERFSNYGDFRHGGRNTLKTAWHSGAQGGFSGGRGGRGGFSGGGGSGGNRRGRKGGRGEYIDTSRFVKKATAVAEQVITVTNTFSDFNLSNQVEQNLIDKKFTIPSPIQDQAIPHIMEGKDLIGLANTGTGKTAAFLLPLIEKISADPQGQSALILAPTRELAQQIDDEFKIFAKGMKLYSAICVGGMPAYAQIQTLRRNPHLVIGTPGRIQDLADRGFINFKLYNNIVLDEVDHMLDMGFVEPITAILNNLPEERQSLFFSATMPDRIRQLVSKFLKNPVVVEIQSGKTTDNVEQDIVRISNQAEKFPTLVRLLKQDDMTKILIFSETKRDVERLTDNLRLEGFAVNSIHGDKTQRERQRALNYFKDGTVKVLVATDVAARGIDVKDISHVINYTIPQTHDDYVHRIGRTGRGNKGGTALTFV